MGTNWSKDEDAPGKEDKYEWRLPENGDQHGEQTVAPGDLLIKPGDLNLIPTISPKRSGIQHGLDDWTLTEFTDEGVWYRFGSIEQED
ncbi:MAG: hypothetical protein MN733_09450 [Nitrososphaera sp.]|nr:hypothetical protein [Nitrososphaera sp.]